MKKTALIIGFLGVFMILGGLSTLENASAEWQPFTDTFYNCGTGEAISITGMDQWVEKGEWYDASGGYHVLSIYMARGTGIGESGSGYKFNYRQPIELINAHLAAEGTYIINGVLIALDKNVPDLRIIIINKLTFDADGNLRSEINIEDITCTEP